MKVSLTINDVAVEAELGMTVLEAAQRCGIYIPTLCYHPELPPFGACRLCVVEVEGMRGYPTACTVPAADGMIVHTETEALQRLRREILALILSEHPYSCLVCERRERCSDFQGTIRKAAVTTGCQYCPKNGACDLQKLAKYVGLEEVPYPIAYRGLPVEQDDPFFDRDYNLCILCGRCVRVCQEVRLVGALAFIQRGSKALVGTAYGRSHLETECEFCGSCVDVCPTGALADRRSKWEGPATSVVASICPYCSVGCTLDLHVKDGRLIRTIPNDAGVVNKGQGCVRGRFGIVEVVESHERLTAPLIRKDGRLVQASWDEALQLVAERFTQARSEEFALIASATGTNEENYVLQKFTRAVMGSNNVDFPTGFPQHADTAELIQTLRWMNGPTIHDVAQAGCVLVIGANLNESHPLLALQIRRALRRGGRLIVLDARRTRLAEQADLWLQPAVASDHIVLAAMMKAIVEEGLSNPWLPPVPVGVGECSQAMAEFQATLQALSWETVEAVTNVPQEKLREAARLWIANAPGIILYGSGVTHHPTALNTVKAITLMGAGYNLALHRPGLSCAGQAQGTGLTGNLGRPGGGVLAVPGEANFVGAYDMGVHPAFLPGYVPVSDPCNRARFEQAWGYALPDQPGLAYAEIMQAIRVGQVKVLYLAGEVPPREELQNLEFLVIQDILPGPNLEFAHVILPTTTFAESGGTFTNLEGRVQQLRPAIPPRGNARAGWAIPCQIAQNMGKAGFDFTGPEQIMDEIARLVPAYAGIGPGGLDDRRVFTTVSHIPNLLNMSLDSTPDLRSEEFPLVLLTENNLLHYRAASLTRQVKGIAQIKHENVIQLNVTDASRLGISDGDIVRVMSEHGAIRTVARVTPVLSEGVAFTSVNRLSGSALFPGLTPIMKACAVRVERCRDGTSCND